ncbi:LptF/LptG family permease [Viscerimonas tarda]
MLRIKRLYLYILQEFMPMFFMTFAICLFILLMQFLWKYVEDLVGKGLDLLVFAELFMYATLSLIPMALPLAILLASLMTFGNLGERVELTATKAAGISLLRTMRPLIVVIGFVCIGAFFFQNEAMPKINVKITTLMRSIKMKSPELDIPEGTFYNEIENFNLFVKKKNKETGTLYGVIIYDTSEGFDRTRIILCDSANLKMSANKDYLLLTLLYGQQFANFDKQGNSMTTVSSSPGSNSFVPYSRENFQKKEIIIPFDANFNRMNESTLQGTQLAKNIKELQTSIDSLAIIVDSLNVVDRDVALNQTHRMAAVSRDTTRQQPLTGTIDLDSLLNTLPTQSKMDVYANAAAIAEMNRSDLLYRSMTKLNINSEIRNHKVEWHKKFTLSFACLIFFFIGAPLGAIIRKGGLGVPVVVSVILFIIYYIFDNVGRKMARDGVWDAWEGIWLSSFILFPLGVFLTYKAMKDSALLNMDAYRNNLIILYKKLLNLSQIIWKK